MYLATTALRDFWPGDEPFWLLSSGCLPGGDEKDTQIGKYIQGIITDPFDSESQINAAYADIVRITDKLISVLAVRLNVIHHEEHSERYWRIRIGIWALMFVSVIYDRYSRLVKAKSELGKVEMIGSCVNNKIVPTDTADFETNVVDDAFNQKIYTALCKKLDINIVKYEARPQEPALRDKIAVKSSFIKKSLRFVYRIGQRALNGIFASHADVIMVSSFCPRWFETGLLLYSRGKILPLDELKKPKDNQLQNPVNEVARASLSKSVEGCDDVISTIIEMVGLCLPKAFVEDHKSICKNSDDTYKSYHPKLIYSASAWWFDETFKEWAARCHEQGAAIVGGEHGGAPFSNKFRIYESMEISLADYYLSWGWTEGEDSRVVPGPGNKLIIFPFERQRAKDEKIVFVSTIAPRHSIGAIENFADYIAWQQRFLSSITPHLQEKILARVHFEDYGWRVKEHLLVSLPTLQFDSWNTTFKDRLRSSRLYVFDYASTTLTEAMAANVPSIVFWNEEKYPLAASMIPHFQLLKDCHIFHESPESAAQWADSVYYNVEDWWGSESCQRAVRNFCVQYARTSRNPLKEWNRLFHKLLHYNNQRSVCRSSKNSLKRPTRDKSPENRSAR
jgi:putative transferase (TIGR04331 family)